MVAVSVIIPVYNAGRYLQQCLDSIRNQTLKNIEIICVNDGSTDDSLSILQSAAQIDDRIIVVSQENSTAGAARNRGLEIATGKYLSFLDADDFFEENMLENAYQSAEENNADIVVFRSNRYDEGVGDYTDSNWTVKEEYLPQKKVFSHRNVQNLFGCIMSWAWDKLFDADFIKQNELYFQSQPCINDLFFVYSALAKAQRIYFLNEILIHKRVNNPEAITTNYSKSGNWCCFYNALKALRKQLIVWNIYGELRRDFVNYSLHYTLWNLDKFINVEVYKDFYNTVKNEWLENLDILSCPKEFFYNSEDFEQLCDIKRSQFDEYKWSRRLKQKDGSFLFPFELVEKGSNIILYGAGVVGITYYRQVTYCNYCNIVAWVDKNYESKGTQVVAPKDMNKYIFDYVIIAINDGLVAQRICEKLETIGIAKEKLIWKKPEI